MQMRNFLKVTLLTIMLMIVSISNISYASSNVNYIVEYAQPDIYFKNSKNKDIQLRNFFGKVIVLNFWATWCPPCIKEMPALGRLQKDFSHKGLEVIAVSQDFKGIKIVKKFLEKNKLNDIKPYADVKNRLFNSFKAKGLPVTIILSRDGTELKRYAGEIDWDSAEIREFIEGLL